MIDDAIVREIANSDAVVLTILPMHDPEYPPDRASVLVICTSSTHLLTHHSHIDIDHVSRVVCLAGGNEKVVYKNPWLVPKMGVA